MELAKYKNEDDPRFVIQNWMLNKNRYTYRVFGKNYIILDLTVCNSRRLKMGQIR